MKKEKILEYQISGICDNCREYGTIFYDYLYQKYWCKNCLKVRDYDFSKNG